MDEQSQRTARRQYHKIFDLGLTRSFPTSPVNNEERFNRMLSQVAIELMEYRLGDEEFDNIQLSAEEASELTPEDFYSIIDKKFKRLVEILAKEENDLIDIEAVNTKIREELSRKMRESENLISKKKQELKALLDKNTELFQMSSSSRLDKRDEQEVQEEIENKDDTILQLNKNIQQMMEDFIASRDKASALESKFQSLKRRAGELKQEVIAKEEILTNNSNVITEKERELENFKREYHLLIAKNAQAEKKLDASGVILEKKAEELQRLEEEYSRILEKNNQTVKKLAELEKQIEKVTADIEVKNNELEVVRNLNKAYEDRINRKIDYEALRRQAENEHYDVRVENELLKEQLKQIAPHSVLDKSTSEENVKEIVSHTDIEKYADMKPEEILRDLESLKKVAAQTKEKLERLEKRNSELGAQAKKNNAEIDELKSLYHDRVNTLEQVRTEKQEALQKTDELEREITVLLGKFDALEKVLGGSEPERQHTGESVELDATNIYKFSFKDDLTDERSNRSNGDISLEKSEAKLTPQNSKQGSFKLTK